MNSPNNHNKNSKDPNGIGSPNLKTASQKNNSGKKNQHIQNKTKYNTKIHNIRIDQTDNTHYALYKKEYCQCQLKYKNRVSSVSTHLHPFLTYPYRIVTFKIFFDYSKKVIY